MKKCEHTKGMTEKEREAFIKGFKLMEDIMQEIILCGSNIWPEYYSNVPQCVKDQKADLALTPVLL